MACTTSAALHSACSSRLSSSRSRDATQLLGSAAAAAASAASAECRADAAASPESSRCRGPPSGPADLLRRAVDMACFPRVGTGGRWRRERGGLSERGREAKYNKYICINHFFCQDKRSEFSMPLVCPFPCVCFPQCGEVGGGGGRARTETRKHRRVKRRPPRPIFFFLLLSFRTERHGVFFVVFCSFVWETRGGEMQAHGVGLQVSGSFIDILLCFVFVAFFVFFFALLVSLFPSLIHRRPNFLLLCFAYPHDSLGAIE